MRIILATLIAIISFAVVRPARADDDARSRVILVDEGGSYDVAVHPDFVTVFYFPDKITKALASDPASYEVKSIGSTSLAIRPLRADAKPANLAIATESLKVSVVLSIATKPQKALTQVTFKRADLEAELEHRISEAVTARTADLEAQVAEMKRALDAKLPTLAEGLVAERVLVRRELRSLKAIERNDDNVIVRITEAVYLGEDAYLIFEIQNRDKSPYRLASVEVLLGDVDRAGLVHFSSTAAEAVTEGVLGVVAPSARGTGVVVLRRSSDLIGKPLTVKVSQPSGRGLVVVDKVVLR